MGRDFEAHAAGRIRGLRRQTDDLQFVLHLVGDNFDNLTNGELPIVAAVVDLTGGCIRVINREQHAMCQVSGITMSHQVRGRHRRGS